MKNKDIYVQTYVGIYYMNFSKGELGKTSKIIKKRLNKKMFWCFAKFLSFEDTLIKP